jgi:hypothetical protein
MARRKFKVGDKVTVIGSPAVSFTPGVKDELANEKPFTSMVGKVYTVKGFDKIGNAELWPKRSDVVWIEPEFLQLRREETEQD